MSRKTLLFVSLAAFFWVFCVVAFLHWRKGEEAPQRVEKSSSEPAQVAPQNSSPPVVADGVGADKPAPLQNVSSVGLPQISFSVPQLYTLKSETIVSVRGQGLWAEGFEPQRAALVQLHGQLVARKIEIAEAGYILYTGLDDAGYSFQAAFPVRGAPDGFVVSDGLEISASPEGRVVVMTHKGAPDDIEDTYDFLDEFMARDGLRDRGVFIEQYLSVPQSVDDKDLAINVYIFLE